jgi:hypothetical protein
MPKVMDKIVISPIFRFFAPSPEAHQGTKPKYHLVKGRDYLIKEKKPRHSVDIFIEAVKHGVPGLWITSTHPGEIRREHHLVRTPIIYLTVKRVREEITTSPRKLDRLITIVSNYFIRAPRRSVVHLDCFGELVGANGFERSIDFLTQLRNICRKNASNLIVQANPMMLTRGQLAAISKQITG